MTSSTNCWTPSPRRPWPPAPRSATTLRPCSWCRTSRDASRALSARARTAAMCSTTRARALCWLPVISATTTSTSTSSRPWPTACSRAYAPTRAMWAMVITWPPGPVAPSRRAPGRP